MKSLIQYYIIFSTLFFITGFYRYLNESINANIFYFFFLAIYFFLIIFFGRISLPRGKIGNIILFFPIFLLYCILNIIFNNIGDVSIDLFISHIYCYLFLVANFTLIRSVQDNFFYQRMYNIFFISVLLNSFFVFYEGILSGYGVSTTGTLGRGDGFFLNSNHAGAMLTYSYIIILTLRKLDFIESFRYESLIHPAVFLGVLATFSKGSLVILLVAIFLNYQSFNLKNSIILITASFIFFISFENIQYFLEFRGLIGRNTFDRFTDLNNFFNSFQSRLDVIPYALGQFFDKPIFGHGLGYNYIWQFDYAAHNIFLFYLVDLGIIGFGLIVLFLSFMYKISFITTSVLTISFFFSHNLMSVVEVYLFISIIISMNLNNFSPNYNLSGEVR